MSKRSLTYVRASSSFSGFSADFTLVGIKEKKKKLSISAKSIHIKYIYMYIYCVCEEQFFLAYMKIQFTVKRIYHKE